MWIRLSLQLNYLKLFVVNFDFCQQQKISTLKIEWNFNANVLHNLIKNDNTYSPGIIDFFYVLVNFLAVFEISGEKHD